MIKKILIWATLSPYFLLLYIKIKDFKIVQGDIRNSNLYLMQFSLSHIQVDLSHKCSLQSDKSLAMENKWVLPF